MADQASTIKALLQQSRNSGAQGTSPFTPDQSLESQAQAQGQVPMHPLVQALVKKLGLMSLLRNRANTQQTSGGIDMANL
jgi:hypothetical protein